jgi:DNA repair protein RadC
MGQDPATRYTTMIRDLPQTDRPRERMRELGAGALSNAELIAILMRTGAQGQSVLDLSTHLLASSGGLAGLAMVSYGELCGLRGVSDAKACQLLSAFELGRRLASLSPEDRATVRSAQDVANLMSAEMGLLDQEHLRVLLMSTKGEVRGVHEVYVGNVNASIVRVSEVLRPAVRENCPSVIIVHNHPSGDPTPSPEDVLITRKIVAGGEMLDVDVLDHIIIGDRAHVSLKSKGLGFPGSAG